MPVYGTRVIRGVTGMAELVSPIIPDAQRNRAPDLLLEGFRTGLAGAVQLAQLRRQSETDIARLALAERSQEQEHNLAAQRMSQDYELRDRSLRNEESLLPYRKQVMEAQAEWTKTTRGAQARQNAAKIATLNDFNRQIAKYGLDNPNPNPVDYYANARRLKDEFAWADMPVIKGVLGDIMRKTKEHTIPLQINAAVKDADGKDVIKSVEKFVPIGEIIEGIRDPKKYDSVMRTLERSGLMDEKNSASKVLREYIQAETKRVESGGGTDFKRSRSRVAPGGSLSDPTGGTPEAETVIEDVDESDLFGSVKATDTYLSQARAALARKANPKAVAARLKSLGVDPSLLWAT